MISNVCSTVLLKSTKTSKAIVNGVTQLVNIATDLLNSTVCTVLLITICTEDNVSDMNAQPPPTLLIPKTKNVWSAPGVVLHVHQILDVLTVSVGIFFLMVNVRVHVQVRPTKVQDIVNNVPKIVDLAHLWTNVINVMLLILLLKVHA